MENNNNNIESMKDKIKVQPKNSPDDEFLGDLNKALSKKIEQATDRTDDNSPIDAVIAANEQQPSNVLLDDQEYEQLNLQLQQRVDTAINTLTDVRSDLVRLLASDLSHAFANDEIIHTNFNITHAGITIDSYNTVTRAINELKSEFNSPW